jgi:hypothetical protein
MQLRDLFEAGYEDVGPMIRVYHAQFHLQPDVLRNRDIKSYNSMGTWFTSSKDVAAELYGDKLAAYDIPAEGWLEMDEAPIGHSLGHCYPLIAKHLGMEAEDTLTEVPWDQQNSERLKQLRAKDREDREDNEKSVVQKHMSHTERREMSRLAKSEEVTRQALRHQGYCQDFRQMITASGRRHGMVWRNVHWDGSTQPSNIYLVFHEHDMHPVEKFVSDRKPGKNAGLLSLIRSVNPD